MTIHRFIFQFGHKGDFSEYDERVNEGYFPVLVRVLSQLKAEAQIYTDQEELRQALGSCKSRFYLCFVKKDPLLLASAEFRRYLEGGFSWSQE